MKLLTKSVTQIDHAATGAAFRAQRVAKKLSLRAVAGRVGVSAAYLSDLETGKRNWSVDRLSDFQKALK